MTIRPFEGQTLRGLTAALGGLAQRQQAIAANIANVDTPNYQATDVDFEGALRLAMGTPETLVATDPAHLTIDGQNAGARQLVSRTSAPPSARRNDGNTVDLDREMARLAETSLRFNAVASLVSAKYASLRTAINEGRR
ncbi:MAG: flagellar basal body rod protein FlgB [Dehalococcoidia bacterium]